MQKGTNQTIQITIFKHKTAQHIERTNRNKTKRTSGYILYFVTFEHTTHKRRKPQQNVLNIHLKKKINKKECSIKI